MPDSYLLSKRICSVRSQEAQGQTTAARGLPAPGGQRLRQWELQGLAAAPGGTTWDVPLCRRGQLHQASSHRVSWVGL